MTVKQTQTFGVINVKCRLHEIYNTDCFIAITTCAIQFLWAIRKDDYVSHVIASRCLVLPCTNPARRSNLCFENRSDQNFLSGFKIFVPQIASSPILPDNNKFMQAIRSDEMGDL